MNDFDSKTLIVILIFWTLFIGMTSFLNQYMSTDFQDHFDLITIENGEPTSVNHATTTSSFLYDISQMKITSKTNYFALSTITIIGVLTFILGVKIVLGNR